MKTNLLLLLLLLTFTLPSFWWLIPKRDWSKVTTFHYYGFTNPLQEDTAKYVTAPVNEVRHLLQNAKKTNWHLTKGASRYAKITFSNTEMITIQILPGQPIVFREIEKSITKDRWYTLNEGTSKEFEQFLTHLQ